MNGKYFWLKLKKDFFKRHDIRIIEGMPDGKEIVLFYIKLMLESIDHEGKLRFSDEIPYTPAMLASVTNTDIGIVTQALTILSELNLLVLDDNGTFILPKVMEMVGYETEWAKKKREYRETLGHSEDKAKTTKGQSEDNVLNMSSQKRTMSDKSKSIEKEKEIELDIKEKNIKEKTQSHFIPPTVDEVATYCFERNNGIDAEKFVSFYEAKGWYIGKNKMKDWKAAVRTWEGKQKETPRQITNALPSGNPFDSFI